jgi:hypothetical protein
VSIDSFELKETGVCYINRFQEDIKMRSLLYPLTVLMATLIVSTGCDKKMLNFDSEQAIRPGSLADPAPPPEPIVTVAAGGSSLEFLPWKGTE